MSTMLDLPDELLFLMVYHVLADNSSDIERLAICCRQTTSRLKEQLDAHQQARRDFPRVVGG